MQKVFTGFLILAFSISGFFGFMADTNSVIRGKVIPGENAVGVSAISGADTFRSKIINGRFEIVTPIPGTYNVMIQTTAPYKNETVQKDVVINKDETVDLGQIQVSGR